MRLVFYLHTCIGILAIYLFNFSVTQKLTKWKRKRIKYWPGYHA